jgi:rSAM/selenodomain-associated transferase 2
MSLQTTIIIPVLNEAGHLATQLQALQDLRGQCQLVLVDGGSDDDSVHIAERKVDKLVSSPKGRAKQMNAGAEVADGDIFLFLHADTSLPDSALNDMAQAIAEGHHWGRFDVAFDAHQAIFKVIAFMMNHRSRITGIATGDQGLFVTKQAFQAIGGFPDIALMEDIAISKQLNKLGKPACLKAKVVTSARRWQQHGVIRTILLMWYLRLAYFFGADPDDLARIYYGGK